MGDPWGIVGFRGRGGPECANGQKKLEKIGPKIGKIGKKI